MKLSVELSRISLLLFLLAGVLATNAGAQTPLGDYQFQQVYTSSSGTLGALTQIDPSGLSFVTDTVNGQSQYVLQTSTTSTGTATGIEGGVQTPANPFTDQGVYSIVLLASFQVNPMNVGATKVFDFSGLTSDAGLYINATTGLLQFIDGTGAVVVGGTGTNPITTGTYFQLSLTRTAADVVTGYVNGTQDFQFTDSSDLAVLSNVLTLFADDGQGVGGNIVNEGTTGTIARLRLYDAPLSAAQIGALVPEPAPAVVLLLALALVGLTPLGRRYLHQAAAR